MDTDTYIKSFPAAVRERLELIRAMINRLAPGTEESFSYGMPAFKSSGRPFVYFAAFRNHIGFYALPVTHKSFAEELSAYKHGKGSVQFPHSKELPLGLIEKILRFRLLQIEMEKLPKKNF